MRTPELPSVFSRADARDLGVSDVRLASLVRRGVLVRLRRGVYARVGADPSRRQYIEASTVALSERHSGHALSHLSAAAAWDLPLPLGRIETVHLTVTARTQRSRRVPGVMVHHADSSDTDVAERAGIPVTTAARTVADCLRDFGPLTSVPIADAALNRGLASVDDVVIQLAMQCHWLGRTRSERSLWIVDGRRESWLESYAFVRFVEWGVDLPEPQVRVFDEADDFVARVDAGWLDDGTVLELDGKGKYLLPNRGVVDPEAVWREEKRRYDRVGNLGLERVRFGLTDLLRRESAVRADIRARRRVGSSTRFSGRYRLTPPSGLTLL
jgi:hypothetical protein